MPDILINFYIPNCTEDEARLQVYSILPFDPDSDTRHKVESWVEVKPEIHYPPADFSQR